LDTEKEEELNFIAWQVFLVLWILPINHNSATDYPLNLAPQSYVPNKFQTNEIVFLGTRHKQPPILEFISEIITALHNSGVTQIDLEIASDQQGKIDQFMKTGAGLTDIDIHQQTDCPEYRNLYNVIRGLEAEKRPTPFALDLPKTKYKGKISRDEWMAKSIVSVFESNPNAKMLAVVGNNHVLKKMAWQDHVPNPNRSIRQYLTDRRRKLRFFQLVR
jgi:uncharacterized iron-regulated protein